MSSIITDISVFYCGDFCRMSGIALHISSSKKSSRCSSGWDLIIWTPALCATCCGDSTPAYLFQDKSTSIYRRD